MSLYLYIANMEATGGNCGSCNHHGNNAVGLKKSSLFDMAFGNYHYYQRTAQNVDFAFYGGGAYIIDKSDMPKKCVNCGNDNYAYLFNDGHLYAPYNKIEQLPLFKFNNIWRYVNTSIHFEPNFGTFLCGTFPDVDHFGNNFILYHPTQQITELEKNIYMISNKPTICCAPSKERNSNIILLNADGVVDGTEIIYESYDIELSLFNIKNGCLKRTKSGWVYVSGPVLNTKPAAGAIDV